MLLALVALTLSLSDSTLGIRATGAMSPTSPVGERAGEGGEERGRRRESGEGERREGRERRGRGERREGGD